VKLGRAENEGVRQASGEKKTEGVPLPQECKKWRRVKFVRGLRKTDFSREKLSKNDAEEPIQGKKGSDLGRLSGESHTGVPTISGKVSML